MCFCEELYFSSERNSLVAKHDCTKCVQVIIAVIIDLRHDK